MRARAARALICRLLLRKRVRALSRAMRDMRVARFRAFLLDLLIVAAIDARLACRLF